jgi:hypothetical protein
LSTPSTPSTPSLAQFFQETFPVIRQGGAPADEQQSWRQILVFDKE